MNFDFKDIITKLDIAFKKKLPGVAAQMIMAPKFNGKSLRNFTPDSSAKKSAVLVLIFNDENTPKLLFTLRSQSLKSHRGQISFPGGRCEPNESIQDAAIRETFEEIGLEHKHYYIFGKLTELYVQPSNSIIYPFVAYANKLPRFVRNPDEVEEIFLVDINNFFSPHILKHFTNDFSGIPSEVPYFDIHKDVKLWGATAIILNELLEIIKN